jgi:hypothetical protein
MAKKTPRPSAPESQRCIHFEQGWNAHPELTRWVAPLGARFCMVCCDWIHARDRQTFLRYVRNALVGGKTGAEIARMLDMEGIADPFAEPPRTLFDLLLTKSKYRITAGVLKRLP